MAEYCEGAGLRFDEPDGYRRTSIVLSKENTWLGVVALTVILNGFPSRLTGATHFFARLINSKWRLAHTDTRLRIFWFHSRIPPTHRCLIQSKASLG